MDTDASEGTSVEATIVNRCFAEDGRVAHEHRVEFPTLQLVIAWDEELAIELLPPRTPIRTFRRYWTRLVLHHRGLSDKVIYDVAPVPPSQSKFRSHVCAHATQMLAEASHRGRY